MSEYRTPLATLRRILHEQKPRKLDPELQRDLTHGWLLPYLLDIDSMAWGRWDYWSLCQGGGKLPDEPIPQIEFNRADVAQKMLEKSLEAVTRHGSWHGWSSATNFDYFIDWLLFGFGYGGQKELPAEPNGCEGASMRLYQVFNLGTWMLHPFDYLGDILSETNYGRGQGFFPTPHPVVEMMTRITMGDGDCREQSVMDPCCGTGRMLLHASNHSLRLYGMDIDRTVCRVTLVNAYLFAPWLAAPIDWLDRALSCAAAGATSGNDSRADVAAEIAGSLSDTAVEMADPQSQLTLFDTEFDAQGFRQTAPILKRRSRRTLDDSQALLMPDPEPTRELVGAGRLD